MTPQDLGLPFPSWRPGQFDMVMDIALSPSLADLLIAPTGWGKSLGYTGVSAVRGGFTVILTATKALQDQLMRDFEQPMGLVDVRGQSNYDCAASNHPPEGMSHYFRRGKAYTVRDAPCTRGVQCPMKEFGCHYYDRIREAQSARVFTTNYDFWMRNKSKFDEPDLLVMDEAHQAPGELQDFMSFRITREQKRAFGQNMPSVDDPVQWRTWAKWAYEKLAAKHPEELSDTLRDLKQEFRRMSAVLGHGEWVVEFMENGAIHLDCTNAAQFGRAFLWGGAAKVLMVSATVNPMTAAQLGIPEKEVKVWEAKSGFPVERRPVYFVEGSTRLSFRSQEGEKRIWLSLIDRIVGVRQDRKGIIHTTSFERAKYIIANSRWKSQLILNESSSTAATVAAFRSMPPGKVLVSPSVTTGWDFPLSQCEYQIIGKIPFPDLRTKAAKIVNKENPEWAGYAAAQTLVQSGGRGVRSADDQCETFIVDGNFDWWFRANRKYIPKWFQEAVRWVTMAKLPEPPPRL